LLFLFAFLFFVLVNLLSHLILAQTYTSILLHSYATPLTLLWALCVVASRVLLGRHHVLDVVAGMAVGYLTFLAHYHTFWISPDSALGMQGFLLQYMGWDVLPLTDTL
jgi:membrane-associated phospholipid phosphatase